MKWTAGIAVAAGNTVRSFAFQMSVMIVRQFVPGLGEVVIFVDKPHVQTGRAGLAVIAVHADAV